MAAQRRQRPHQKPPDPAPDLFESAAVEERWRLDAERAKVNVPLTAMVHFVVDDVEDQVVRPAVSCPTP